MPLYAQDFIVFNFLATALCYHKTNNPTRIPHLLELRYVPPQHNSQHWQNISFHHSFQI